MRIAILHPAPAPYREKFFAELARLDGVDLVVYYCCDGVGYRDWQFSPSEYQREVLPGIKFGKGLFINPSIIRRLCTQRPDISIIWGWSDPSSLLALCTCRYLGIPATIFSDSAFPYMPMTGTIRRWMERIKRKLVKIPQAFLVQGGAAKQYILALGAMVDRVHVAPANCIDKNQWRSQAIIARGHGEAIKRELGLKGKRVLLYVGRLDPEKGLLTLLSAYGILRHELSDIAMLVVGGGRYKSCLEACVFYQGLKDVVFLGTQPYEVLPKFFSISECLVLPTLLDQWPLVLLEAMASGLPVVTTDRSGSPQDLINGRGTGLVVEAGNAAALTEAIKKILSLSADEIEAMRQRTFAAAAKYDYRLAARRVLAVLKSELNRSASSHS